MWGKLRDIWLIALGAGVIALIVILEWLALGSYWGMTIGAVLPRVVAVGFFAVVFLYHFSLPDERFKGIPATDLLVLLRSSGYMAELKKEGIKVRLGSLAAVRFLLDKDGRSTGRYAVDATPQGYGGIIILVLLTFLTVLSVPIVVYISLCARAWVQKLGSEALNDKGNGEPTVRSMLVGALAELHRISTEAFESERSNYHDRLAIGGVMAILLGGVVLILVNVLGIVRSVPLPTVLMLDLLASLIALLAYAIIIRRDFTSRLKELKGWSELTGGAWQAEMSGEIGDGSSFETIMDALPHLTEWLEVNKRSVLYRDPGTTIVAINCILYSGVLLFVAAYPFLRGDWMSALPFAWAGLLSAAAGVYLLRRSKRRLEREATTTRAEFQRNLDQLRTLMDSFWEGV